MLNLNNLNSLKILERGSGGKGFLAKNLTFKAPLLTSLFASGKGSTTPTFTRATTAYVNDYETIPRLAISGEARFLGARRVRNQFTKSEDFTNASWTKNATNGASTYTGNADFLGGTTAMKIVVDNATSVTGNDGIGGVAQTVTKTASVAQTVVVSFYAKAGEAFELRLRENTSTGYRAVFNLVTGAIAYENSATAFSYNSQMVSVGNGWWRCQVRYVTSTGASQGFTLKGCGAGTSTTGDGVSGLYVAFAQFEDVTASALQIASEYVTNGVLSAPYHGANVDGVNYFSYAQVISQNLVRASEDLSTIWTPTDSTVSVDTGVTAPNGSQSYRVYDTGTLTAHRIALATDSPIIGTSFIFSGYIKAGDKNTCVFRLSDNPFSQGGRLRFTSISAMSYTEVVTGTTTMSSTVTDVGNGWRFVSITVNFPTPPTVPLIAVIYLGPDESNYTGTGQYIQATGFSLRQNSVYVNSTYLPTTTSALYTVASTIGISSSVNYGYLSENSKVNLALQSETFDNATWTKTDITVTPDSATVPAPNGYATADLMTEGVAGTAVNGQGSIPVTANTRYTFSVFVKAGTGITWFRMRYMTGAGSDGVQAWFNITTGALGTNQIVGTGTLGNISSEAYPNGWYRLTLSGIVDVASTTAQIQTVSASADASITRVNSCTYYLWGAQLELSTDATSYIPTTTVAVTRNVDLLTYPVTSNASATLGTVYSETKLSNVFANSGGKRSYAFSGNTANRLQGVSCDAFGNADVYFGDNTVVASGGSLTPALTTLTKTATRWTNGLASGVDSSYNGATSSGLANTPNLIFDRIEVGLASGNAINGTIRNFKIYKIALTDTQLNQLTA